jgi:hypothetical protein
MVVFSKEYQMYVDGEENASENFVVCEFRKIGGDAQQGAL